MAWTNRCSACTKALRGPHAQGPTGTCAECGAWLHRACGCARDVEPTTLWCPTCLCSAKDRKAKVWAFAHWVARDLGVADDAMPATLAFAVGMLTGKTDRAHVRAALEEPAWPPLEEAMERYEAAGLFTAEGEMALDEHNRDDPTEVTVAWCLAIMCGAGEVVRGGPAEAGSKVGPAEPPAGVPPMLGGS